MVGKGVGCARLRAFRERPGYPSENLPRDDAEEVEGARETGYLEMNLLPPERLMEHLRSLHTRLLNLVMSIVSTG